MLVSDLVGQYHNNSLSGGPKIATKTKGVEQLSKVVSSLEKGQIFEGTVKSVKGDQVTLSLSSGQNITAKLDKGVGLSEGQSVFFQVKSNEGGTVQIRPVNSEFGGNPTLLNALKSAGLPENETNLKLVNAMMKEQMPIDKDSIKDMIKTLRGNPGANIDTLVSMKKLDLPINSGMITQFENYKESEGAILKMVGQMGDEIPKALSSEGVLKEDVIAFQNELLNIISSDEDGDIPPFSRDNMVNTLLSGLSKEERALVLESLNQSTGTNLIGKENVVGQGAESVNPESGETKLNPESGKAVITDEGAQTAAKTVIASDKELIEGAKENKEQNASFKLPDNDYPRDSIGGTLSNTDRTSLSRMMSRFPEIREMAPQFFDENGNIKPETKGSDLLKAANLYFKLNPNVTKADMMGFLDSTPVKNLTNHLMSNHWTLKPEDITKKGAIDDLYKEIEEDMEKISASAKKATHQEFNPISDTAQGVKDNLSFIREVNQLYQYIQIPLKMSGEKATGELFVYANKKQKRAENDEITAFLHFDLEHLGSTDISVKLAGKKLDTRFFIEDDISYQLIEKNLPMLEETLSNMGYNCKMEVENDSKKINFVEDFLKQDSKTAGDIHRYSFDVRA